MATQSPPSPFPLSDLGPCQLSWPPPPPPPPPFPLSDLSDLGPCELSWPPPPPFPLSDLGPCELSWFEQNYSYNHCLRSWVFWSTLDNELEYHHQRPLPLASNRYNVTGKITCALKGLGPRSFNEPYLIQFWGLVNNGDGMYLTTCDQPFSLTHIFGRDKKIEGLCRYRKHCLDYLIAVDETNAREGELGPPGRVLRSGLPEYLSDVSHYSSQEYPQRDLAVNYFRSYHALPVYQSPDHNCIGVLEFVSTGVDRFIGLADWVNVLKRAGLTTICPPIPRWEYIESSSCHGAELYEIGDALEEVCENYQILVARPWVEANSEKQLLTIFERNQYGQHEECFSNTNRFCFIQKGHGVVGKAFSSRNACFCRDISQLSITEDPFVSNARTFGFSSCFAICLQSSCSNGCIYTLEFFLPTNETNSEDPRTLLCKIMEILEKHLQSYYNVASGQELGQNLVVAVIKVSSDDIFDSFEIFRTIDGKYTLEIVEVQNQVGMAPPDGSFQQVDVANNCVHDINVQRNVIVGSPPAPKLVQNLLNKALQQPIEELDITMPASGDATMKHKGNEVINLSDLSDKILSWSEWKGVFWTRYNDELRHHHKRRLFLASNKYNSDRMMKRKIRYALRSFDPDLFSEPYLIQFWGLVNIGESMYLTTCDQPFALTLDLDSEEDMEEEKGGLCRYRKHCLEYLIAVDETSVREEELGPPGRVFRSGLPESIFDVSHYSSQEYPQRDLAVKYLKSYHALPVYQSPDHKCVGVLEFVSTENDDGFDVLAACENSFEMADLTTICPPIARWKYIVSSSCHDREIHEIDNALGEVCETCQIPVAQRWIETNSEEQLLTIFEQKQHGQCHKWFDITNRSCFIRKGHGIVGKAFSSQSACFCRDLRQLSITEYALIPGTRECGFSSCFAICLQSSCLNRCIYTLEFLFPTNETNSEDPRTLLRKIMEILKKHLQSSFKVALGQELGQNLVIAVIKVSSDDKFDSFEICCTNGGESPPVIVEVQNQVGMMLPNGSFHQVDAANNSVHDINVQQNVFVGSPPAFELVQNLLSITHRQTIEKLYAAIPASDDATMKHNGNEVTNLKKRGSANYTLEGARGITLNDLQQRSAMKLVDAAEDLEVSRSTLKRICRRYGIQRWPPHKARKCNQAIDQQEFSQPSKKNIETHSMSVATRFPDDSIIMVKAIHEDVIIKFQLSLAARKMDLDEKVAMRLNLQVGSFRIMYLDEENDWVSITCDEDLSVSLNMLRSVGKTTIKMLVCH